ncbi:hypothetical protein MRX96_020815 [Rhipicephalus microplus]
MRSSIPGHHYLPSLLRQLWRGAFCGHAHLSLANNTENPHKDPGFLRSGGRNTDPLFHRDVLPADHSLRAVCLAVLSGQPGTTQLN